MSRWPIFEEWGLYFPEPYGYENRLTIMKAFVNFLDNPDEDKLEITGECLIGGIFFGYRKISYGEIVLSSPIISIEKIETDKDGGNSNKLMRILTKSNSICYFSIDDCNEYMQAMLKDFRQNGELKDQPGYYLRDKDRTILCYGTRFI